MKLALNVLFIFLCFISNITTVLAHDPLPATVQKVEDIKIDDLQSKQWLQLQTDSDNQTLYIENLLTEHDKKVDYKSGDRVLVQQFETNGPYVITDYFREKELKILGVIFLIAVVFVGQLYGLSSIMGMGISLIIIVKLILPLIAQGYNPLLVVVSSLLIITPLIFYLSHGINLKTHLAVISTFITIIATGLLAYLFVNLAHITGFASEEASFLDLAKNGAVNIQTLLIAGIVVGALGVLDDVTISQVSIVNELLKTGKKYTFSELYQSSMNVGRDHVASVVNTLVLVYAGANLPLLLLFQDNSLSVRYIINTEIVAEEIVRTLVGSIGLILSVPITTYLACKYLYTTKTTFHDEKHHH